MYLCAVQMSGSSAFSNQSLQWCLLQYSISFSYRFLAFANSACIVSCGLLLRLLEALPSLLACLLSSVSSFVHHCFVCGLISEVCTCTLITLCKALVMLLHSSSRACWLVIGTGDTLQHRLYMYSNQSGEPENRRTRAEETERSGHQRQRVSEEFHSQARPAAETPGMHQTKPRHRSSLRALKWRRCRDTRSV